MKTCSSILKHINVLDLSFYYNYQVKIAEWQAPLEGNGYGIQWSFQWWLQSPNLIHNLLLGKKRVKMDYITSIVVNFVSFRLKWPKFFTSVNAPKSEIPPIKFRPTYRSVSVVDFRQFRHFGHFNPFRAISAKNLC